MKLQKTAFEYSGQLMLSHLEESTVTALTALIPPTQPSHEQMVAEINAMLEVKTTGMDMKPENVPVLYNLVQNHDVSVCIDRLKFCAHYHSVEQFHEEIAYIDRHIDRVNEILAPHPAYHEISVALITSLMNYDFPVSLEREAPLVEAVCRIWVSDTLTSSDYLDVLFPSGDSIGRKSRGISDVCLRDDLAECIVNHPGKEDALVELILDRAISDPAVLSRMVEDSVSTSLISGVL